MRININKKTSGHLLEQFRQSAAVVYLYRVTEYHASSDYILSFSLFPPSSVFFASESLESYLMCSDLSPQTCTIVNTISETMNLNQGAISKAILQAAGPGLQSAVRTEAGVAILRYGDVIITKGFKLKCQRVFHAACPTWDNGTGQAQEVGL